MFEEISTTIKSALHWEQVKNHVDDQTQSHIRSILLSVAQKFNNTEFIRQDNNETITVEGNVVAEKIKPQLIMALQTNDTMNKEYINVLYDVIINMDTFSSSNIEKLLKYRDIEMLNEIMIYNNILKAHNRDAAQDVDGLKYFWELYKQSQESTERFTSFIGSIAYHSKASNTGSNRGYIQTINILAIRHQQNRDNFRELTSAEEMLKAVPW